MNHNLTPHEHQKLQQLFSRAFAGLLGQEFQQARQINGCLYRAAGGRKCAIGHCIEDQDYDPELDNLENFKPENLTNPKVVALYAKLLGEQQPALGSRYLAFELAWGEPTTPAIRNALDDLQSAHDDGSAPYKMVYGLGKFAAQYGLDASYDEQY